MHNSALQYLHQFRIHTRTRKEAKKRPCAAEMLGSLCTKALGLRHHKPSLRLHSENIDSYFTLSDNQGVHLISKDSI